MLSAAIGLSGLAAFVAATPIPCNDYEVDIAIVDTSHTHVHPPGDPFRIEVTVGDSGLATAHTFAQWLDPEGVPLAPRIELGVGTHSLLSPGRDIGYYGLRFFSDDTRVSFPPQNAGFTSGEYGFAILPTRRLIDRTQDPRSFFGTVHTVLADPYIHGGSKTLTWNSASPTSWTARIAEIRDAGLTELPLVNNDDWDSDDDAQIPQSQLDEMSDRFRDYLLADPTVLDWELGLEENAGSTYDQPYYFHNLIAKAEALRAVADQINPDVRFVYNVRGFDYDEIEDLFAAGAMERFQVFAIHPYRWTEFPTPELWFENHVRWIRFIMRSYGAGDMSLWITEFGLPVRGNNDPDDFFGYPSDGNEVPGATREHAARYIVKGHAIAAFKRVEKLFVYNYQNRGDDIRYAEDHFGLRSYTEDRHTIPGHPLPAYVAYAQMIDHVADKRPPLRRRPHGNVWVFDYWGEGSADDCLLAWVFPEGEEVVPLGDLRPGLTSDEVVRVVDIYGRNVDLQGETVRLTGRPVYITVLD
ncbi:MAG: hypothetical protein GY711_00655 [bacterium]|nr:hypothetical protein [bacterium]